MQRTTTLEARAYNILGWLAIRDAIMKKHIVGYASLLFIVGFVLGGYVFIDARPHALIKPEVCLGNCGPMPPILGLLMQLGVKLAPKFIPFVVAESKLCIAIDSPTPEAQVDVLFFPRRGIRHSLDLREGDAEYIVDCYALMHRVALQRGIKGWLVFSNGPGLQQVSYLHFHLLGQTENGLPPASQTNG